MAATTCHAPAVVAGDSFLSPLLTRSWEKHTLCGEERPSELTRFLPMRPAAECACVCGVELAGTGLDLCGPATVTPSGCLLSPAGLSPASPLVFLSLLRPFLIHWHNSPAHRCGHKQVRGLCPLLSRLCVLGASWGGLLPDPPASS